MATPTKMRLIDRWTLAQLSLWLVGGLWIIWQAVRCAFTFDESTSFFEIQELTSHDLVAAANFQPLNSGWLLACRALGLEDEWQLRGGSVLSFPLFAWGIFRLAACIPSGALRLLLAALLLGNLFLLDFFFLARGYAMSCALLVVGLVFFERALKVESKSWVGFIFLWGAVLANYSAVNWVAGVWLVILVRQSLIFRGCTVAWKGWLWKERVVLSLNLAMGLLVIAILSRLKARGQLFFGGRSGFWEDTVGSLVRTYRYMEDLGAFNFTNFLWGGIAVGIVALAVALFLVWRREGVLAALDKSFLTLILLGAVLATEVQCRGMGSIYPYERTAVSYFVVFVISAARAGSLMMAGWKVPSMLGRSLAVMSVALACVIAGHSFLAAKPAVCYTWKFDADNQDIAAALRELRSQRDFQEVGVSGILEEGIRFSLARSDVPVKLKRFDNFDLGFDAPDEQLNWEAYGVVKRNFNEPSTGALRLMLEEGGDVCILSGVYAPFPHLIPPEWEVIKTFPKTGATLRIRPSLNSVKPDLPR